MGKAPELLFYKLPSAMEPLMPEEGLPKLEHLAIDLIEKSSKLSGALHPITRAALADFLRPMNSYYSNLIEGHDTHPIDIDRALHSDYSDNKEKRALQLEAKAHIAVHKVISDRFASANGKPVPSSIDYLKFLHAEFYKHLPKELRKSKTLSGDYKIVVPGEFRNCEVKVGNHIAPHSESLPDFMHRFERYYNGATSYPKAKRLVAIAASHHRLAWIHPFLDGNGRVVRLYSDACFMLEAMDADGLWSISRGLARRRDSYTSMLANADLSRRNDYDGRGNLSNKALVEFCTYFLETAIDQIEFMFRMLGISDMVARIENFVDLMVLKKKLKPEAKYILIDVFLKGRITKKEAMRLTNKSDKTLKIITDDLIRKGLLKAQMDGVTMYYYVSYSIKYSPLLFPGLYPSQKEIDIMMYDKD
jgi:Fic family protein